MSNIRLYLLRLHPYYPISCVGGANGADNFRSTDQPKAFRANSGGINGYQYYLLLIPTEQKCGI